MYTLKLVLDIQKDARNRWNACNKISHGMNRREKIDKEISDKLIDKTQEEVNEFLMPYLINYYNNNEKSMHDSIIFGQKLIDRDITAACEMMEKITNTKIYRQDFTGYITTFPRGPYNFEKGYVWLYYNWSIKYYIGFFLHELLHFQFIYYFTNHPAIVDLNTDQFEFLKEALTFILNYEFKEFLGKEDVGYPIHKNLRDKLALYWESNKNFEELIIFGANILKENGQCKL